MCFTIFIIKSEWHLYSCRPDKTSGKIVTTAKSSGRANCDTLHNARHTHTRATQLWSRRPIVKTHRPRIHNCAAARWPARAVNENDWQLLLLTDSYYYEAAVVIINDWWLWHLCQAGAGAQPHLLPSHHFFTNSLPMLESWHQKITWFGVKLYNTNFPIICNFGYILLGWHVGIFGRADESPTFLPVLHWQCLDDWFPGQEEGEGQ